MKPVAPVAVVHLLGPSSWFRWLVGWLVGGWKANTPFHTSSPIPRISISHYISLYSVCPPLKSTWRDLADKLNDAYSLTIPSLCNFYMFPTSFPLNVNSQDMNRDEGYPTQLRMTSSFKLASQTAWCGDCGPGPLGGLRMATENSRSYILRTILKARTFQG